MVINGTGKRYSYGWGGGMFKSCTISYHYKKSGPSWGGGISFNWSYHYKKLGYQWRGQTDGSIFVGIEVSTQMEIGHGR